MAAKKTLQDCSVVAIGFTRILLPAQDALKLMSLMRNACEVEIDWRREGGEKFIVGERPRCEMQMVSPRDLIVKTDAPAPSPRKPLLLGKD